MIELPDPENWDEPEMHRALAFRNISKVYRLLVATGISQHQIAQLTGQTPSEVSEIIKGRRVMTYDVLKRIADGLGVPHGHMGLAYTDAEGKITAYSEDESKQNSDPWEDDELITRRVLGSVAGALLGEAALDGPLMQRGGQLLGEAGGIPLLAGSSDSLGTLTKQDVAWIRAMTARLWELDIQYGGGSIFAAARGTAEQVVGALRASSPNRDLYLAASGLCRIAAWSAFDAGRKRDFWQCHATALDLARESGDLSLVIKTVQAAGRAHILTGNHRAAAQLFELTTVRRAPDAVGWGLLGSAYAPNSPESAKRALVRLRDAPGADTSDATAMIGHVSLDLGDYPAAVAAFNDVLPQRSGRLAVQETVPLAIAYLNAQEMRIGLQHAETAVKLSELVRSKQSLDAVQKLGTVLAAQNDSTAQDLAKRVAATQAG